jgi:hypothetical protein
LTPLIETELSEPVAAVWISPNHAERHYIVPGETPWPQLLSWLAEQALPEFVPGIIDRISPKLFDNKLHSELAVGSPLASARRNYEVGTEMYNLLIGDISDAIPANRLFEHTSDAIKNWIFAETGYTRMLNLPTLLMPEIQSYTDANAVARVGHIEGFIQGGSEHRFHFVPNPSVPEIPLATIQSLANQLGVEERTYEFQRTHWAVKDVDLYQVIFDAVGPKRLEPSVFAFPENEPRESDLVAVMMPFSAEFTPVYAAIKQAVTGLGLRCVRADDIWDKTKIMDDVISLLWRSHVVVADLTGKNPNVFYETGIAHSLGRDFIPIAQSMVDVPFDLHGIRTLVYLCNNEGIDKLSVDLAARLKTLTGSD